jgi:DNA-binding transcriptional regulator LsrR (DeoR family)
MSDHSLAEVARLYYVDDLTKQEIGSRLGISRFKVARLLDRAKSDGIVRIHISEPVETLNDLAGEVAQRFDLHRAVVVRREGELGPAGAAELARLVRPGDVLGVAWGATLQAVVEELHDAPAAAPVVQICGAVSGLEPGTGPTELALRFAERFAGAFYPLPAPALPSRDALDALLRDETVQPTVRMFDEVSAAVVGIGVRDDAAGHVLVHVFDEDGRVVETEVSIAMSVEQLARARVLAVAGGRSKRRAVRGALRTGLLHVLVTDESCARYALG